MQKLGGHRERLPEGAASATHPGRGQSGKCCQCSSRSRVVDLYWFCQIYVTQSCCPLQIAVQMAVVFAKVARVDYPKAWPSLFTDLLQQMQSQNTLVVRRVYLVLHHALKELASKRLGSDQKAFAEVMAVCCSSWPLLHLHSHQRAAKEPGCIPSISQ